jgi:GNAT superfamily N-acetyltransferase
MIEQIQENWSATARALGSESAQIGSTLIHTRVRVPRGGGFWNFALTASCPAPSAEQTVETIQGHFHSRAVPYAVYTFDGEFHSAFLSIAENHHLARSNTQTIMVLSAFPHHIRDGRVRRINATEIPRWVQLMGRIFDREGPLLEAMGVCYLAGANGRPNAARFYVAEVDGQFVGTACAYLERNIAGVHSIGVLGQHRNRGLGTALTMTAVHDAVVDGASFVWLRTIAGDAAEPLYTKLGFRELTHCHAFRPRITK